MFISYLYNLQFTKISVFILQMTLFSAFLLVGYYEKTAGMGNKITLFKYHPAIVRLKI